MRVFFIVVFCIGSTPLLVNADPTCLPQGNSDVVCRAGTTDYVLKKGLVSENGRTTGITLRDCRISGVDFESFHELPSLEYLDLSVNNIQKLKLGVLDGFQHLKLLNLSHNLLTGFPMGIFDQKPEIDVLDLKGNKITNLEVGILDPMRRLRHLDVSSNEIKGSDINPFVFDKCRQIHFIDFSRNDMNGAKDNLLHAFRALDFINLDRCRLTEVPKFVTRANLNTMKHLMLSTNNIKRLDQSNMFMNLDNLEILNLVDNAVESIVDNVFAPLRRLKMVLLTNNRLKQIPDALFQQLPNLNILHLSHNVLEYVPVNAFRGSPIRTLNLAYNRFTYLSDNFCLELRNSGGRLAEFSFEHNPWQCACLLNILNEVKAYDISYNPVRMDGNTPICVTTNQFLCKRQPAANEYYNNVYYNSIDSP